MADLERSRDGPEEPTPVETVELAAAAGYFDTPRRVSLLELADRVELTDEELSRRLRAGVLQLLAERAGDRSP